MQTLYTEAVVMEGGEKWADCGTIRSQNHQDLSPAGYEEWEKRS